jgi:hypothetical protein
MVEMYVQECSSKAFRTASSKRRTKLKLALGRRPHPTKAILALPYHPCLGREAANSSRNFDLTPVNKDDSKLEKNIHQAHDVRRDQPSQSRCRDSYEGSHWSIALKTISTQGISCCGCLKRSKRGIGTPNNLQPLLHLDCMLSFSCRGQIVVIWGGVEETMYLEMITLGQAGSAT